jgi:heterodisulfide reductase subunit B
LKYALYLGCTIQNEQYGCEISTRETLPRLGVELIDMEGTSCCGLPAFSSLSMLGWFYLSTRNIAIAEKMGLDILALCNGCYESLIQTKYNLDKDPNLQTIINDKILKEGLEYTGTAQIIHPISLLHDIIGVEFIEQRVKKPLKGLKFASHPGCHAIRPSILGMPDDPEHPQKMDNLITALGAETMDYPEKVDCCGSMLVSAAASTTLTITAEKLKAVEDYGFDGLVTTCPFCFQMFDGRQEEINEMIDFLLDTEPDEVELPIFYYTQLLGLAMGMKPDRLGLHLNKSPVDRVLGKIEEGPDN